MCNTVNRSTSGLFGQKPSFEGRNGTTYGFWGVKRDELRVLGCKTGRHTGFGGKRDDKRVLVVKRDDKRVLGVKTGPKTGLRTTPNGTPNVIWKSRLVCQTGIATDQKKCCTPSITRNHDFEGVFEVSGCAPKTC
jgi:hypothetical protein